MNRFIYVILYCITWCLMQYNKYIIIIVIACLVMEGTQHLTVLGYSLNSYSPLLDYFDRTVTIVPITSQLPKWCGVSILHLRLDPYCIYINMLPRDICQSNDDSNFKYSILYNCFYLFWEYVLRKFQLL